MSIAEAALDYAAELIATACGIASVSRSALAEEPEDDGETGLVIALATGTWTETGYCIGAAKPHEFDHAATLEVLAVGGDEAARKARVAAALAAANEAIAADPTLGGAVDLAELTSPDPTDAERFVALAAVLQLTFTAPDALG